MPFDAHPNFAYSTVATPPAPPSSGTALTVAAGDGALFAGFPFDAVVWPANALPLSTNAEVVRVTGRAGDVLTITRAVESSSARAIVAGDQIAVAVTGKVLTDIEAKFPIVSADIADGTIVPADVAAGNRFLLGLVTILNGTISYTPSAAATALEVEGIGGGGGGSGTVGSAGTTSSAVSGGGGSGAYSRKFSVANVAGAHTVAVGGGGAGGVAGANNGTAGGDTSFADTAAAVILLAKGGGPGTQRSGSGTAVVLVGSAAGGAAASGVGDLLMDGGTGPLGGRFAATVVFNNGGGAPRGGPPSNTGVSGGGSGFAGNPGNLFGGGGCGGVDTNATARAGGRGADGVIEVHEYS